MLENLPDELLPLLADRLQALGDPLRLRLLRELCHGPRSVGALVAAAGCSQPNVSRHLARLEQAGFVRRERHGNQVLVSLDEAASPELCEHLCGMVRRQAERLGRLAGIELKGANL